VKGPTTKCYRQANPGEPALERASTKERAMASIICSSKLSGTLLEPMLDPTEVDELPTPASTITSASAILVPASATSDHRPLELEYSEPSIVRCVLLLDGSSTLESEELLPTTLRSSVEDLSDLLRISNLGVWQADALEDSPCICCCSAKAATAKANPPEEAASGVVVIAPSKGLEGIDDGVVLTHPEFPKAS